MPVPNLANITNLTVTLSSLGSRTGTEAPGGCMGAQSHLQEAASTQRQEKGEAEKQGDKGRE